MFIRKIKVTTHPQLAFSNNPVQKTSTQKHLGMFFDFKLNLQEHFANMLNKANNIGLLWKYKILFVNHHTRYKCSLDHTLIMAILSMIKRIMRLFSKTVESIQYNVDLAIAGDIRGTSKDKLFEELDLECLQYRRWYRNLCCFYKILKDQSLKYLFNVSSKLTRPRSARNTNNVSDFKVKQSFFKNTVFCRSSLNGAKWTLKFKILLALIFPKRIF